ncbi:hypothetical protein D1B31_05960 [Neobacillus notoginsengisoli]|uniref:Lipoprotein n=1 Tax=Neobacillus notoginsengisoli TaxID=1578198 RepID=A0A417YX76_9BACI|nr:DUF6376 family protein [Neobacillus notoginsengisoli]RHW42174.1 hypothetical protein D1B31_05960 [Neobacillus notoginsengisoli]
MNKRLAILAALLAVILGGCSESGDGSDLGSYAAQASEYLEKAANFAKEASLKAEEAVHDEQAKEELKSKLIEMKKEINEFSQAEAPKMAEGLHQNITEKSGLLEEKIDRYLVRIENGTLDEDFLKKENFQEPIDELKEAFEDLKEKGK